MKNKTVYFIFLLGFLGSAVLFAADSHNHEVNVIKVNGNSKTALCACGMEVNVTDETLKVTKDGNTYYLCSDGCKTKFTENFSTIKPMLDVKVNKAKAESGMLGNVYKVNDSGEMVAKCACGMDVAVTDEAISRELNGQTYYLCNESCATMFDKNPDKVIKTVKEKVHVDHSSHSH